MWLCDYVQDFEILKYFTIFTQKFFTPITFNDSKDSLFENQSIPNCISNYLNFLTIFSYNKYREIPVGSSHFVDNNLAFSKN